jgi:hypothetical protein
VIRSLAGCDTVQSSRAAIGATRPLAPDRFAQKYDRDAGVGTVVALMLPYVAWMFALWILLFIAWYLLGLPWGV